MNFIGPEVNELNQFSIRAAFAALIFAGTPLGLVAAEDTPLTKVAADLGFGYGYLGPEDAVALTRPGVTVVIRPGVRLFDVNDRTEAMDGAAPRFSRNDVFVSHALVARLRQIAARYPLPKPAIALVLPSAPAASTLAPGPAPAVGGAITGLSVTQVAGQQEVAVSGKAPANLPITLTLVSTFSTELPDVVLNRHEVIADADGTFKINLPIASGFFRGSILTLVATSLPGTSSAKTQIVMKAPNGSVTVPADQVQSSIR